MIDLLSLTTVLARLFALYMLVTATFSIPAYLSYIKQASEPGFQFNVNNLAFILPALAYVALALLLLICAKQFAGFLTRGVGGAGVQISEENFGVLQAVAFSILGAYVLSYAIPNLVKYLVLYLATKAGRSVLGDDISYPPAMGRVPLAYVAEALAQFALGLWLVLGSRGISGAVRRVWANNIKAE